MTLGEALQLVGVNALIGIHEETDDPIEIDELHEALAMLEKAINNGQE